MEDSKIVPFRGMDVSQRFAITWQKLAQQLAQLAVIRYLIQVVAFTRDYSVRLNLDTKQCT